MHIVNVAMLSRPPIVFTHICMHMLCLGLQLVSICTKKAVLNAYFHCMKSKCTALHQCIFVFFVFSCRVTQVYTMHTKAVYFQYIVMCSAALTILYLFLIPINSEKQIKELFQQKKDHFDHPSISKHILQAKELDELLASNNTQSGQPVSDFRNEPHTTTTLSTSMPSQAPTDTISSKSSSKHISHKESLSLVSTDVSPTIKHQLNTKTTLTPLIRHHTFQGKVASNQILLEASKSQPNHIFYSSKSPHTRKGSVVFSNTNQGIRQLFSSEAISKPPLVNDSIQSKDSQRTSNHLVPNDTTLRIKHHLNIVATKSQANHMLHAVHASNSTLLHSEQQLSTTAAESVAPNEKFHRNKSLQTSDSMFSNDKQQVNQNAHAEVTNFVSQQNNISRTEYNVSKKQAVLYRTNSTSFSPIPKCPKFMYSIPLTDPKEAEFEAVNKNLERCLEGANLRDYFVKMDYLETARKNLKYFFTVLRAIIPANFNREYSAPCWNSKLNAQVCEEHYREYNFTSRRVDVLIGDTRIQSVWHSFGYTLQAMLRQRISISSPISCLPKLFIVGFPKCGSTQVYCLFKTLAKLVTSHYVASCSGIEKEPHMWVPLGPFTRHSYPHQLSDFMNYIINYFQTAKSVAESNFTLPIDASPNLIFQWPQYSRNEKLENYCLIPAVLPYIIPESKYVVVMRNPVDMLYSAFWFSCSSRAPKMNKYYQIQGPNVFHEKVKTKINMFLNCNKTEPPDACLLDLYFPLSNTLLPFCGRVRLEVGFYYLYIRRWLSVIPRRRFLFLTVEELRENTSLLQVANKAADFADLGVQIKSVESLRQEVQEESACKNTQLKFDYRRDPQLRMRNDTRQLLEDFFRPFNHKLAELLGDQKYLWETVRS